MPTRRMSMSFQASNAIPDYIIRPACEGDVAGILHCLASAFEVYRQAYSADAFADTTLDVSSLLKRMKSMHVLVAVLEDRVVGTVAGSFHDGEGHLRGMAVLPDFSGTGVAAALLLTIEQWLLAKGCARVTLDTTEPLRAAKKFYEKHGYSPSGRVTDFFGMPLIEYQKNL